MVTKTVLSFACAVLLVAGCIPVAAQTVGSARPFRGALFGANRPHHSAQRLNLSVSLLEAYHDDVFGTAGASPNPGTRPLSGNYTMLEPLSITSGEGVGRRSVLVSIQRSDIILSCPKCEASATVLARVRRSSLPGGPRFS